ncbi:MAG: DUF4372 domain-containing protein [Candidatus Acidiferrales bacterium]
MNLGKTVFAQLMDFIPAHEFRRGVARYRGQYRVRRFSCGDQFLSNLRIKAFYGFSENAVKTQIGTAIAVYVLVAIVRKRLGLDLELHAILQILSVSLFEKVPLRQVLTQTAPQSEAPHAAKQLQMFTF